jgi:precorrin-6B methylase 2
MSIESDVPPTVGAQLAYAERVLATAGSRTSRDEARALLGSLLRAPVALLLAQAGRLLSQAEVETYARWVARRATGEALPHITGHLGFMGLDLTVGRDTPLVSPGAQRLVEVALERARHHLPGEFAAAEIGTGCGAIALALAAFEPRFTRIYAVDAAASTLRIAEDNGARYLLNLVITWLEGEGPDAVPEPVDLIVCGQCGNATSLQFARLLEQAPTKLRPGGAFACGLDSVQEAMAAASLERAFRGAQIWVEPPSDGVVIVIAQVPRATGGDAAFERSR